MAIYDEDKIMSLLFQYNPWWKSGSIQDDLDKPQKRFVYHEAIKIIKQSVRRFIVLCGARRVGKTTVMNQIIAYLLRSGVLARNIVYLSFDNPILKLAGIDAVLAAYDNFFPTDDRIYFFFDEIQYAENWEIWMKVIYDSRPNSMIVATGSASPVISRKTTDSGVGRWVTLRVPTLSFYEYCELLQLSARPALKNGIRPTQLHRMSKGDLSELMAKLAPLSQHFYRYLSVGGFPELALSKDDAFAQRLLREDIVDKVIKRDILALFNVRNPLQLEKLFLYLCINSSGIVNFSAMSKELDGMNRATIESYIEFLKESNLIYISEQIGLGGKSVLKGKPKIYIADAAIRNAVLMNEHTATDPIELGIMVETTIYKHLATYYYQTASNVGYYRKKDGNQKEIDVVVEIPTGKILCEVKFRENSAIAEDDAIVEMTNHVESNVKGSIVITKSPNDFGIVQHHTRIPIIKIPAASFLYLLGRSEHEGYYGQV